MGRKSIRELSQKNKSWIRFRVSQKCLTAKANIKKSSKDFIIFYFSGGEMFYAPYKMAKNAHHHIPIQVSSVGLLQTSLVFPGHYFSTFEHELARK